MRFAPIFAFNFVLFGAYGIDSGLRVSLELFDLKYVNDKYAEGNASTIQVSNRTKKFRASGLIRYPLARNLEINVTAFKIVKKSKEYLFTRINRKRIHSLVLLAMVLPIADDALAHVSPKLTWPPTPNVTYTLRDYWLPNSQVPTDLPLRIPTGRFRGIGTVFYPNETVIASAEAIINIIHSYEKFD